MPDHLLVELGVRTIGSRLRIRSAASHWLENQVFLLSILILFVFLFCCKFLLQQGEENGGEVDGDAGESLGDSDVDGAQGGDGVVRDRGAGDGGEWMSCLISLLPTRMMSGCVLIK